jgi:outer membrane protein
MPLSIEGSAPSIIQAKAVRSLWNPQQSYLVAQSKEASHAASLGAAGVREEVVLRTALLFLDLEKLVRGVDVAQRQVENLNRVAAVTGQRVAEGREIELESKKATLNVARGRQRVQSLGNQKLALGRTLASILALDPQDVVEPALEERSDLTLPSSEEQSVSDALNQNKEIRRLESELLAKGFQARAYRASRLPRVDLIAQYALLARFNNYDDFFRTFQRNNGELGASIIIPLFPDPSQEARAAQSDIEARRLKVQLNSTRSKIQTDTLKAWEKIHDAETGREVARMDLDVSRDQVSVLLAQMEEGRATLRQVEEARFQEGERWLAYYDMRYAVERARMELLKETSALTGALR